MQKSRRSKIVPAIMPQSRAEIEQRVAQVRHRIDTVQLDIMDGALVPPVTWPFIEPDKEENLPYLEEVTYEVDFMVKQATEYFDQFLAMGVSRMVFHANSEPNILSFITALKSSERERVEIGIAIHTTDSIETYRDVIVAVDFIQCMGIARIGDQGESFDERVLAVIQSVRSLSPDIPISVDGSVNSETLPALADAGADQFAVGSAVWGDGDPVENISELESLIE